MSKKPEWVPHLLGTQHHELQSALLVAFNEADLRQLARQRLDANLDAVAGGRNTTEIVNNLIAWAEREGRVADLIRGALLQNPTNPQLQELAEAAKNWRIEAPASADEPPYKGLAYFDVADAPLFFGREALTVELITYLKTNRFLAIVGASGSGKSSLVRAGVVAQLAKGDVISGSDKWAVFVITPTAAPLKSLAAALTRDQESVTAAETLMDDMAQDPRSLDLFAMRIVARTGATRVLIVADQFEEVFTLCKDVGQRKAFIDNLLNAATAEGAVSVVLTLRADFYAQCAEYESLRTTLASYQKYIGAMSLDELRTAIEKPANDGNWMLETGLTNRLLRDITNQPGSLPLLSHALMETWRRRSKRILTFQGYEAAGGVQGAIAKTADSVYDSLLLEEQATARSVFIHLTSLGEDGASDTRRRILREELSSLPNYLGVLQKLENARLVTAERDSQSEEVYVEVVHEAVIREWPHLRGWLQEDRDWLRAYRTLCLAADEWLKNRADQQLLFSASRLRDINQHLALRKNELTVGQQTFLIESYKLFSDNERTRQETYEKEIVQRRITALIDWAASRLPSDYYFRQIGSALARVAPLVLAALTMAVVGFVWVAVIYPNRATVIVIGVATLVGLLLMGPVMIVGRVFGLVFDLVFFLFDRAYRMLWGRPSSWVKQTLDAKLAIGGPPVPPEIFTELEALMKDMVSHHDQR